MGHVRLSNLPIRYVITNHCSALKIQCGVQAQLRLHRLIREGIVLNGTRLRPSSHIAQIWHNLK